MKTFNELGKAFNAIMDSNNNNMDEYQMGHKSFDEWVAVYDANQKKLAGWRRSVLCSLAKLTGETYKTVAEMNYRRDNVDLYCIFCREARYI